MYSRFFAVVLSVSMISSVWAEKVSVKMNTARPCQATVERTDSCYIINVQMRSVRCFDAVTNRDLSYQKAEGMAISALLNLLAPNQKKKALQCSGLDILDRSFTAEQCRLTCKILQKNVKIVPWTPGSSRKTESSVQLAVSNGSLLTLKSDYSDTISAAFALLDQAEIACPCSLDKLDEFYMDIAQNEEAVTGRTDALRTAIRSEVKLLSMEKDELLKELDTAQSKSFKRLARLSEIGERLEKMKKPTIEPDFASGLLTSPVLIESGGFRVIETGEAVIAIAVASAIIPDEGKTASIRRLKARKLAEARAKAAFAQGIKGVEITTREQSVESTVVTIENGVERGVSQDEYSKIIETHSAAFLQGVETIGQWETEDGELFIAIGARSKL